MIRHILLSVLTIALNTAAVFAQSSYNSGDTGQKVLGSYFASDVDTVSLSNGNLHVNIPLFSLPGRQLPLSLAVDYNSKFAEWRVVDDEYGEDLYLWEFQNWRKTGGIGPLKNSRKVLATNNNTTTYVDGTWYYSHTAYRIEFTYIDAVGTKNVFTKDVNQYCTSTTTSPCVNAYPSDANFYDNHEIDSTQSEFFKLKTNTQFSGGGSAAVVVARNGNQIIFGSTPELRTTNGNRLIGGANTATPTPYGYDLSDLLPLTDTVGRTVSFSTSSGGDVQTVTLTSAGGQSQVYQIQFGTISAQVLAQWDYYTETWVTNYPKTVQAIVLPNGRSYQFEYNTYGYLSKLTFPSGAYIRYEYANRGGASSLTQNPRGYWWLTSRKVSSDGTAQSEKTWTYAYGGSNGTEVTAPNGEKSFHQIGGGLEIRVEKKSSAGVLLQTIQKEWSSGINSRINEVITTPAGGPARWTTFVYDSNNNVTEQYDFDAGVALRRTNRSYVTSTNYTDLHILNLVSAEKIYDRYGVLEAETDFEYDTETLITRSGTIPGWLTPSSSYRGNVTKIKRWPNTGGAWPTTVNQYDVLGNLVKITDPAGHLTESDFADKFMHCVPNCTTNSFAYPTRVTPPGGAYVDTIYDFNSGIVRQAVDSLGRTTTTTFDVMNRPLQITAPNGGWTTYDYYSDPVYPQQPKVKKEVKVDTAGNVGRVITYFDHLYRVTQTETYDADAAGNIFVDTQYDANGRKWKVSNPHRSSESAVWTEFQYDALNRPAPDGSTVQYAYSGNKTTVTDEAGNQRRYTYDSLGRMVLVEEPNPTLATPLITTYTYNARGKLIQSLQGFQSRTFVYDALGRMTSQTLPESGTTTFTYNTDDMLVTKTDARGSGFTVTTVYNTTGHVHAVQSRQYADGTPAVSFSYDSVGRRTQMVDALGSVNYSYVTNTDRLYQEQRTLTGITGAFTTSYGYNIKGDLTQMTYPSGRVVDFNYATGGGCCNSRLASVVDQTTSTTVAGSLAYNAAGETTAETLGNGVTESFGYNSRLQLTSISVNSGALMNFSYDYGTSSQNTGRVRARTDALQPEHSVSYTYDSIYRLKEVRSTTMAWWEIGWTFDQWGNRLTQTPQGLAYTLNKVGTQTNGYLNNQFQISCGGGSCFDSAGNQTGDTIHTYAFNAENQIKLMDGGAAAGTTGATYVYDGEGRRAKRVTSTQTGTESTYYFYGPGGIISEFTTVGGVTAAASTDKTSYRTSDKLGTAVLLMNSTGTVIENNRTLPYGEMWIPEASTVSQNSQNANKFTSYPRDSESTLDYAMARYSASSNGRFTSPDLGSSAWYVPQTLNRYLYTMNDPINYVDPEGRNARGQGIVRCTPDDNGNWSPSSLFPCEPLPPGGDVIDDTPGPPEIESGGGGGGEEEAQECFAKLKYHDAFVDGSQFNHTFWWVQDRNGKTWIISGTGGTSSTLVAYPTLEIDKVRGDTNTARNPGDHSGQPTAWSSGLSSAHCDGVDQMLAAATSFPKGTVPYGLFQINSNTAALYIGTKGGFNAKPPSRTPGWNSVALAALTRILGRGK